MATSVRGRGGSHDRSTSVGYSQYGRRPDQSGFGLAGTSTQGGTTRMMKRSGSMADAPTAYRGCCTNLTRKIQSFKTLFNQTRGPAKFTRPSPTTLNTFANWIDKGAVVQTVTTAQVARWARTTRKNFNSRTATPTTCKNVLCAKFGKSTIKAVTRSKSGSFMVVTSPTTSGKTFCFPK